MSLGIEGQRLLLKLVVLFVVYILFLYGRFKTLDKIMDFIVNVLLRVLVGIIALLILLN